MAPAKAFDARSLNAMSEPMRWGSFVTALLLGVLASCGNGRQRAQWARSGTLRAWPASTVLARLIEQGPHGAQCSSPPPTEMPAYIVQVDYVVARLVRPDRRVIRKYYLEWAPPEVMAKALRMERNAFQLAVRRARWHVLIALESAPWSALALEKQKGYNGHARIAWPT